MPSHRHPQPVRQHGDTLLEQPPQPVYYYQPAPVLEQQRPSVVGRLVWGVVGFFARIVGVLFRLFALVGLGVAVLVLLAVLGLAGIRSGTHWLQDHTPTTTTSAP